MFNWLHIRTSMTPSNQRSVVLILLCLVLDHSCFISSQDEDGTAKTIVKAIEKGENEYQVGLIHIAIVSTYCVETLSAH